MWSPRLKIERYCSVNIHSTPQENNLDIGKLAKICGRLGSSNENERANAGLRADSMLRSAGLTWGDVLLKQGTVDTDPTRTAAWAAQHPEALNPWERGFIKTIIEKGRCSRKQQGVLDGIAAKVSAFNEGVRDAG